MLLSKEMFQKILDHGVPSSEAWSMRWLIRYSVVVKSRGIIQNKGYLMCAIKDT